VLSNRGVTGRRLGGLLLAVACVGAAACPVPAADWATWQRYMEAAEQAWQQGRLAGAEQRLQDAVGEAERQDPRGPQLVRSLTVLAELYRKQGRARDADAIAARLAALSAPAGASAPAGPDLEAALQRYADWLRELGRADEAAMVVIRLHRLREVGAGAGRGNFLFFNPVAELRDYARLLRLHQRDAEARAIEALAAAEATKLIGRYETLRQGFAASGGVPSRTWVQQIAGGDEALDGRLYPEAGALFADAVRTAEAFPAHDVRRALGLSLLATALRAQGRRDEYRSAVARAMPILEKAAGQGQHMLASSLRVLALAVLRFDFEPAEALAQLQPGLRLLEKDVSRDHPVIGLHLAGIAAAYLALCQPEQGTPALERAFQIAGQQYLPEHASLALGLLRVSEVYTGRGDHAAADQVAERVLTILRRLRDPDHPDVLVAAEVRKRTRERLGQPAVGVSLAAATSIPVQVEDSAMLVHVTVNDAQQALLLVDTGATVTALRPLVLKRLGLTIPDDAPRRRVTVVGGETLSVPLVRLTLRVGAATVQNLEVAVTEVSPGHADVDGLLGGDFLQRFKVSLDRAARRMTLEPLAR
jgi:tetratricopeptide (TPR) repeat protein